VILHHIAIVGLDPEQLARRMARSGAREVTQVIEDRNQRVRVQFFRDAAGVLIETVCPLTTVEESPLASRISRGGGIDHLCYELTAEDESLERVVSAELAGGAKLMCAPVHSTAFNRRIAFVFRPYGLLVELVEQRLVNTDL
jgi:methylmalonyl-CoA/ethylmalonyl-CoA epimerase